VPALLVILLHTLLAKSSTFTKSSKASIAVIAVNFPSSKLVNPNWLGSIPFSISFLFIALPALLPELFLFSSILLLPLLGGCCYK
jgi:hypothetical protein